MSDQDKAKQTIAFLRGKKTTLRSLDPEDAPLLTRWINDSEVTQFLSTRFPQSLQDELDFIKRIGEKKETNIVFGIEVDGTLIGVMGIHNINWIDRKATTGAFIGEKSYWGKGYGTDAKMALLDYAFNSLNLHRLSSSVIDYNKRSLAYSLHCGYVVEGTKRKCFFKKGRYHDEIMLGLLKEDWIPYFKKWKGKSKK